MMPSSGFTSLHASPAYQIAMEDLDKLLQDTGSSVEWILSRYSASGAKTSGPGLLDVRTSLSMGITPTTQKNGQEAHTNIFHKDDVSVRNIGQTQCQASASKGGNCYEVRNWYSQKQSDLSVPEKSSLGVNVLTSGDKGAFSDEDALRVFLEEIKQTICNWLSRRKAILQDGPSRSAARDGVAVSSGLCLPMGVPSSSGFEREQSPAMSTSSLEGTNLRENEIEVHQNQKEEEKRCGVAHQKEEGKVGGFVHQNQKEEEKRGGLLLQQDKEAGHFNFETEVEKSVGLDRVMDNIASQLQSDEQPTPVHSQDLAAREHAAYLSPQRSNTQVGSLSKEVNEAPTAANGASTLFFKENEPAAESVVTPKNVDQTEVQLPLTKWTPPTSAVKTIDKSLSFPRAVEVITSPDWLPEGWVTELKTRGSGNSAGSKDKYYVDPISHRRFRSRKEVIAYIERGKPKSNDSPERSPVRTFLAPEPSPSVPNKSNKKAKLKESVTPSSSALPPPMVPSGASPGLLGNVFMPPFRTGQPSEWLVYESLASLPFPMFDPFYYTDFGANKSSSGKGSHVPTRPWFFSGPEASWSPFMDRSSLGKSGEKGRDYPSYFSTPSYPSEVAPKSSAGGVKKSSKRKSTGL